MIVLHSQDSYGAHLLEIYAAVGFPRYGNFRGFEYQSVRMFQIDCIGTASVTAQCVTPVGLLHGDMGQRRGLPEYGHSETDLGYLFAKLLLKKSCRVEGFFEPRVGERDLRRLFNYSSLYPTGKGDSPKVREGFRSTEHTNGETPGALRGSRTEESSSGRDELSIQLTVCPLAVRFPPT